AGMIACDLVYYLEMNALIAAKDVDAKIIAGQSYILAHIVLLGIGAILFALLPVYSKLIQKINTKVVLESATENMQGEIDIQEE
ncbi:MAG: hypothetical protein K2N30_03280, partial [Clostridia bacterium]|nr:hypothetical protein [Clostridia bacterium]